MPHLRAIPTGRDNDNYNDDHRYHYRAQCEWSFIPSCALGVQQYQAEPVYRTQKAFFLFIL